MSIPEASYATNCNTGPLSLGNHVYTVRHTSVHFFSNKRWQFQCFYISTKQVEFLILFFFSRNSSNIVFSCFCSPLMSTERPLWLSSDPLNTKTCIQKVVYIYERIMKEECYTEGWQCRKQLHNTAAEGNSYLKKSPKTT